MLWSHKLQSASILSLGVTSCRHEGPVRLVNHHCIGHLDYAFLYALQLVTPRGRNDEDHHVRRRTNGDLRLAKPHSFNEDHIVPRTLKTGDMKCK